MSSAYAVAGVTAVLQGLIEQGLVDHRVSTAIGVDANVSAVTPDQVSSDVGLNIFFYQVTPNLGWRNECLPSRNARSERLTNQPLALDLHYLVSAHAESDLFSEILLGSAMHTLHERPFFDRAEVRDLLSPPPLPQVDEVLNALDNSGLADQVEQIRVTPEYLSNEDMSKLWSAVQSNYRPSAAYSATVVLIQSEDPSRSSLPVLTRTVTAQPHLLPPTPTLLALEYANQQIAGLLGETVALTGHHLNGPNVRAQLLLQSEGLVADFPLSGTPSNVRVEFVLPVDATTWRAGIYQLSLTMDDSAGNPIESNRLPLTIAPEFANFNAVRNVDDSVSTTITITPEMHDTQSVSLIVGQMEQVVETFSGQTGIANFEFPTLPAGNHWTRVRVDGIDSILINRNVEPPQFHISQQVAVP